MKFFKSAFAFVLLAGALASTSAWAYHGHGHFYGPRFGISVGGPLFWPGYAPYYPYPYPYAPYAYSYDYPPAVVASAAPVYVEQGSDQAGPGGQSNFWYYCNKPDGYYPYVKKCPGGWQKVDPQPSVRP